MRRKILSRLPVFSTFNLRSDFRNCIVFADYNAAVGAVYRQLFWPSRYQCCHSFLALIWHNTPEDQPTMTDIRLMCLYHTRIPRWHSQSSCRSNHFVITSEISSDHTAPAAAVNIIKRQWTTFDIGTFQRALLASQFFVNPPSTNSDYFACYNDVLRKLLNKRSPTRSSVQRERQRLLGSTRRVDVRNKRRYLPRKSVEATVKIRLSVICAPKLTTTGTHSLTHDEQFSRRRTTNTGQRGRWYLLWQHAGLSIKRLQFLIPPTAERKFLSCGRSRG